MLSNQDSVYLRLIVKQPLYEKVWSVVSNCILLATFATTIWLGISQRRANQASVAMGQSADEANTIAEKSLQVANDSETTAMEALSQSSANNNISATNNNNAASQEMLLFEQYCEDNPSVCQVRPRLGTSFNLLIISVSVEHHIFQCDWTL